MRCRGYFAGGQWTGYRTRRTRWHRWLSRATRRRRRDGAARGYLWIDWRVGGGARGIAPDIEVDLSIRGLPARTRPARTGDRGNTAVDDRAPSAAARAAAADRGGESACHPASDAARDGPLTLRREVLRSRDPSVSGNRRDCLTRGPGPNVLCHHLRVCTGSGAAGRHTRRILRARACARYRRHSAAPSADE